MQATDIRSQAILDTLSAQRNQAMDEIAMLRGELAAMEEALTKANKLVAEVNEENVTLKEAVAKLAPPAPVVPAPPNDPNSVMHHPV